jgi:basic membrane protein A and related proteins
MAIAVGFRTAGTACRGKRVLATQFSLILAVVALVNVAASAENFTSPGIAYALGAKFDKSFNESVWRGTKPFKAETGIAYHEVEIAYDNWRGRAMSELIRYGAPLVV